jgi:DNA-directed RNA polymerase subunit RPC12/RpoP
MVKTKCSKCSYEWETNSHLIFVTCPNCRSKTKVKINFMKGGNVKNE